MPYARPILLVEDDPADARALQRALLDSNIGAAVIHAPSADDALEHLRSPGSDKPTMILLDLHMPGTDGLEFLRHIKDDSSLKDIPVVVLTSSEDPQDILDSFELGIAGYMVKSSRYEDLIETVRTIQSYWSLSQLPAHRA